MTVKQEALAALVGILAHVDHLAIDFKDRVEKEIVHLQAEIDLAPKPPVVGVGSNLGTQTGNVTGSGATAEGIPANTTVDEGNAATTGTVADASNATANGSNTTVETGNDTIAASATEQAGAAASAPAADAEVK